MEIKEKLMKVNFDLKDMLIIIDSLDDFISKKHLSDFEKVILFKFFYDCHLKGLNKIKELTKDDIKQIKKEINDYAKYINNTINNTWSLTNILKNYKYDIKLDNDYLFINRFILIIIEVKDWLVNEGLSEYEKMVLFKYFYNHYIKKIANFLTKEELIQVKKDIEKIVKFMVKECIIEFWMDENLNGGD